MQRLRAEIASDLQIFASRVEVLTSLPYLSRLIRAAAHSVSGRARSLLRIAGPSVAERSRAGCKEQRSAEYWTYSSERRRRRRPGSARHAMPGGYSQQAPSYHNFRKTVPG